MISFQRDHKLEFTCYWFYMILDSTKP